MSDETPEQLEPEEPRRRRRRRKSRRGDAPEGSEATPASEAPRADAETPEGPAATRAAAAADATPEDQAVEQTPADVEAEEEAGGRQAELEEAALAAAAEAELEEEDEELEEEEEEEEYEEELPAPAPRGRARYPEAGPPVVRAHAKYVRSSARKARLVCNNIRGKSVEDARAILAHTPRAIARDWSKLLESAVANAENNHELVGEDLYVLEIHADEGPTIPRYRPRALGRATKIRKRTSHLTILLTPKE